VTAGRFIVFEGGDGVGKSTQVRRLVRRLTDQGHEVVQTFEPGDSAAGREIRRLVLDHASGELDPRAEALLIAADKAQHLFEVIRPALARGAVVVCDRYVDSMLAYQGAGRVLDPDEVVRIARWATADLRPDLTVLLDLDPRLAVGGKADKDKFESADLSFHDRARQHFLDLAAAEPERYLVLPARDPEASIAEAVADRVATLLSDRSGTLTP